MRKYGILAAVIATSTPWIVNASPTDCRLDQLRAVTTIIGEPSSTGTQVTITFPDHIRKSFCQFEAADIMELGNRPGVKVFYMTLSDFLPPIVEKIIDVGGIDFSPDEDEQGKYFLFYNQDRGHPTSVDRVWVGPNGEAKIIFEDSRQKKSSQRAVAHFADS